MVAGTTLLGGILVDDVLIVNSEADWYCKELSASCPGFVFHGAENSEAAIELAGDMDVLIGLAPRLTNELLAAMPKLKWVHALTTGVDNLLASPNLNKDAVVSNSTGAHGPQMSELTILLMMSTARNFPRMIDNQKSKSWERWEQPLLQSKTACIIGLGSIAETLAERLLVMGMTLTGVSNGRNTAPGFSKIYPRSELATAASEADFLIVLAPYTKATHHLVDDKIIAAMKPDAIMINMSRGGCVDEEALAKHLTAGTLRAAALDVFAQEPLPETSLLWDAPNLIITPHIGGMSDTYNAQVLPIVINHLNAWTKGGATSLPGYVTREEH